jgi:type II secretory ATPase GspE/PulE/Tfp pilus assembly ATPase PilB-like protein
MDKKTKNNAPEFVDAILKDAAVKGASDIYWLPAKEVFEIRYRIGGIQKNIETVNREIGEQCVSRLKVLAGLLTYRSQIAQDGAIRGIAGIEKVEFRAAVMPTVHGERVTLRILDGNKQTLFLDDLCFQPETLEGIKAALKRNCGMIVLTGPTGCGKTTTIYAMIRELLRNHQDPASIISIEDPVECEIEGISQVNLSRSDNEWNYAEALKSALRQDVKTLIIGEMRDRNVIKTALDAALTGHRVITTFHAGDIASVFGRILHQGFEPFLVASAINAVISQRLVRNFEETRRIPAAAFFEPDDAWRDFITDCPGLSGIRQKLEEYPHASLKKLLRELSDKKIISIKDAVIE